MTVVYEWDVETVTAIDSEENEEGEILDHNHSATYAEAKRDAAAAPLDGCIHRIVLVRDDDKGRSWAYVDDDGSLDEYFEDAYENRTAKVPARFHKEIAKAV